MDRLTDEQRAIQETIRDFMTKECPREVARDLDAREEFPRALLAQIAALGFCGLNVPEEFGGGGADLLGAVIVIEEIAALAPALAGAFAGVTLRGGRAIAQLGSEEQKKRWLPAIARGELLFTYAEGELTGDACSVWGVCPFVALADQVDYMIARVGDACLVVDPKSDGVRVRSVKKLGLRGAHLCRVTFDGAPGESLGEVEAWRALVPLRHIETTALCVGIAQGAYDYAAQYARERVQFGKPILEFEAIRHMLVDTAMDLRAARLLLYQACSLADQGLPHALEATLAHARGVELARRAALQAVQILGGYGYMMEYDAQRYARDALALLDGSESLEVAKNDIAVLLGLTGG